MNRKFLSLFTLIGTTLVSVNAFASFGKSASIGNSITETTDLVLSKEELVELGFDVRKFSNSNGEVRELYKNELVKVRFHEENNVIDFSSFDSFTHRVVAGTLTPRNIHG